MTGPTPPPAARENSREWGIDLARGVALIAMFVAHTSPTPGPADILMLSEYVTFPLFALLVGAGAEIAARRGSVGSQATGALVRGLVLLGLGWLLAAPGPPVVIVLAQLGLLTLLIWPVSRMPAWAVALVGVAAGLVGPATISATRDEWTALVVEGDTSGRWWLELVVSSYYPLTVMVLCASAGILLTRLMVPRAGDSAEQRGGLQSRLTVLAAAMVVVAVLSAAKLTGRIELIAYETTWLEELYVTALAAGVLAGCLVLERLIALRGVLTPLVWAGQMSLTVYVVHVGWLIWWQRSLRVGVPDDAWVNVVGLSVGALVLASLWRVLNLPGPWRRGPLEGVTGVLVQGVSAGVRSLPPGP